MSAIPAVPGLGGFASRYAGLRDRLPGHAIPAVAALREAAAAGFRATGLPSRRVEAWRYTDLAPLSRHEFREPLSAADDRPELPPARAAHRAVLVDGHLRPDLSELPDHARPLRAALAEVADRLGATDHPTDALNAMLFEDGVAIDVPAGVEAGTLEIVSVASGRVSAAIHPRHVLRLGAGANLTVIETSTGPEASRHFHNPAFVIDLGENAHLTHVRVGREPEGAFHLAHLNVRVAAGGTYDGFALNAGGRLSRSEIHLVLDGPGAHANLNGAQLAAGGQVADVTTSLRHAHPNCTSRQTVRTVLTGAARGVFQGKIHVDRIAQKTDGYQMNQALLLSENAEMDSKPQLEIYADDVKCSHGATVGALDETQLFYLRSRGIPAGAARSMLVRAFLAEAIEAVEHEGAREALDDAIAAWWAAHGDSESEAAA